MGTFKMVFFFLANILLHIYPILSSEKSKTKDLDIQEDFSCDFEFRLEKGGNAWRKRGIVHFQQKGNSKNYKPSVNVVNEPFSPEVIQEIQSECEKKGIYYVRFRTPSNNIFLSSIKACELIKNNFKDRIVINSLYPIKSENIMSINYDVNFLYGITHSTKTSYDTVVDFVQNSYTPGPMFPEEKENTKGQTPEQQSFLSKYWWVIVVMFVMMMLRSPGPEGEGQESAGTAQ